MTGRQAVQLPVGGTMHWGVALHVTWGSFYHKIPVCPVNQNEYQSLSTSSNLRIFFKFWFSIHSTQHPICGFTPCIKGVGYINWNFFITSFWKDTQWLSLYGQPESSADPVLMHPLLHIFYEPSVVSRVLLSSHSMAIPYTSYFMASGLYSITLPVLQPTTPHSC